MTADVVAAPAILLHDLTRTLNQLHALGVNATVRYGCVLTDHGFVLREEDGSWSVRLKIHDPDYVPIGDPDDD
jgi:hypothetical protein